MMKLLSNMLVLLLSLAVVESTAMGQKKSKMKKLTPVGATATPEPTVVTPVDIPVADPVPEQEPEVLLPAETEAEPTSEADGTEDSEVAGANLVALDFGYMKSLGPVKAYTSKGWQYGLEWNHVMPASTSGWASHVGLIYRRAKLKGNLEAVGASGESKATNTRTDYLLVYGYGGSGDGVHFFGDGLFGVITRRLHIESGSSSVGDDFYSKTGLGLGFRTGIEVPIKLGESKLVSRIGLGMLTGVKMPSGRLHYNQDTVDVNGTHLTLGADLGWLF